MSGPTEFSEESVRQFMLANGGRVTNHDLVKHFKSWLTHPTERDVARQKFKEYVNRLATMKQENGEKYLMLKKRYYPQFGNDDVQGAGSGVSGGGGVGGGVVAPPPPRRPPVDQYMSAAPPPLPPTRAPPLPAQPPPPKERSSSPSLLDEVMANYQPLAATMRRQLPPTPSFTPTYQQQQQHPAPASSSSYSNSPSASQRNSYVSSASHTSVITQPPIPQQQQQQYRAPPPYRGPPGGQPPYQQPPYRPPPPPPVARVPSVSDMGLPMPSDYGLPTPRHGVFHPPGGAGYPLSSAIMDSPRGSPINSSGMSVTSGLGGFVSSAPPPQLPPKKMSNANGSMSSLSRSSSAMSVQSSSHQRISDQSPSDSPAPMSRGGSAMTVTSGASSSAVGPPLPTRNSFTGSQSSLTSSSGHGNVSRQTSSEDKENTSGAASGDDQVSELPGKNEKISVKERTKTFNKMISQTDLIPPLKPLATSLTANSGVVKRRNSRAVERRGSSVVRDKDDDSSSISTLDQTAKNWMIKAAQGDYLAMVKMLQDDPRLAKHKDFISGYTALHWAGKHGNLDMVKLLAGQYGAPVNVKSHGGYTPLHLACQFGHQEVFGLLVQAYKADPHIRDNAGKRPRQYMVAQDQATGTLSLSSDTYRQLKDRRRNRTRQNNDKNSGILRFGSLSVKVKKTTEAFNNYFGARSESTSLPYMGSGGGNGSGGMREDAMRMPPPRFAPIKKRKSKRPIDYTPSNSSLASVKSAPVTPTERSPIKEEDPSRHSDSDSEYGFNSHWSTASSRA